MFKYLNGRKGKGSKGKEGKKKKETGLATHQHSRPRIPNKFVPSATRNSINKRLSGSVMNLHVEYVAQHLHSDLAKKN